MPNIPKPELERGNYITYSDEPGTIYEPDSGDGGGEGGSLACFELEYDSSQLVPYVPTFTYNEVKNAVENGGFAFLRSTNQTEGFDHIETFPVSDVTDNGIDTYNVATVDMTFKATDPDTIMTAQS